MRICVRVTAARTHSWMARYGSSDTAVTPSIPSSRVKPIALVDARNRNRPSEAPNRHGYYPRTLPASRTTYRRSATAKAGSVRECQRTSAPISDASTIPCAGTKTECSRRAARRRRNRPRPRRTDYTCPAPGTVQHDARAGRHVRGRARRIGCGRQHQTDHHGAARERNRTNRGTQKHWISPQKNTGRAAHNHPDRADARRYDAANRSRIAIGWPADGKGRRTGLQPIE